MITQHNDLKDRGIETYEEERKLERNIQIKIAVCCVFFIIIVKIAPLLWS